ncbi:MAG TPA: sugar ABC transporter permease [Gaiellaceae bacterium]|nr:sugar ABC transporter permease [Gaiellaceae bacterium]
MSTDPLSASLPRAPAHAPRLSGGKGRETLQGLIFAGPALAVLGLFLVYPAVQTIRLAFYRGFGFKFEHYLGLQNFKDLLTSDPDFLDRSHFPPTGAVVNNLKWLVIYTLACLVFGLALAVLTVRVRYEPVVKSMIFVPMAISATAVGVIWLFVYSPDPSIGLINAVIHGIGGSPISFLGRPDTLNYAIIFAYVWASTGFAMVVLSAALKGIPTEIIEAARVDGAGEWAIFRRVMLPMLSLPISVVTVWLLINVIKVFDIIYVMAGPGGGINGGARVIAFNMYTEALVNGRWGYGASIATFMFIVLLPFMILSVTRFRSSRVIA